MPVCTSPDFSRVTGKNDFYFNTTQLASLKLEEGDQCNEKGDS